MSGSHHNPCARSRRCQGRHSGVGLGADPETNPWYVQPRSWNKFRFRKPRLRIVNWIILLCFLWKYIPFSLYKTTWALGAQILFKVNLDFENRDSTSWIGSYFIVFCESIHISSLILHANSRRVRILTVRPVEPRHSEEGLGADPRQILWL